MTADGKALLEACKHAEVACTYGRYDYRMIAGLMRNVGWQQATQNRARHIWQEEGLKIPDKQPPRGYLWLHDRSCLRLRTERRNHVWGYDFVMMLDVYGRNIRMLTMIDGFSRTCFVVHCARRIGADEVIEQLANAMIVHGIPEHIRSDDDPEFVAIQLRDWLQHVGVRTAYIEPDSPWENGYCESFNGTLSDELLNGKIFYGVREAQAIESMGTTLQHGQST